MNVETLVDLFEYATQTHRKNDTFLTKRSGKYEPVSAEEVREKVYFVAAGLASLGIQNNDRVGLLSENRPEWTIADFGILCAGAITVPLSPTLPFAQIRELLLDCEPRALFVSNLKQLENILSISSDLPSLQKIILLENRTGNLHSVLSFNQLVASGAHYLQRNPGWVEEFSRQVVANDIASIIYTSGATGIPKGVMLSHGNIVANVLGCAEAISIDHSDLALSFLPLSHIFERTVDYLMFYRGATIAYAESVETVAANMHEVRPTVVACVPRFFEKMYARIQDTMAASSPLKRGLMSWALHVGRQVNQSTHATQHIPVSLKIQKGLAETLVFSKLKHALGGRVRFFISGGAPLAPELADYFFSAGILILEGYGLTETAPVIAVNRPAQFKFGTVGLPLHNVSIKIAPDGEILTRGPAVMKGYYGKEAETRAVMEDGWFHTGDIGVIEKEGFLKVTDRKKEIIVTASGKNIAPQKIENLLKSNPHFLNIVVVGNRRPYLSALVVPNPSKVKQAAQALGLKASDYGKLLQDLQIYRHFMGEIQRMGADLASFEKVKRIVLLEDDFSIEKGEMTATLKIRRRIIEDKYKDLIEQVYNSAERV